MRIDRDFLSGAFEATVSGRRRKERERILGTIRRPGVLDLLSWQLNNTDAQLTPVPDTGHPLVDRLQWFMDNFDEIWAFVQKIIEAIEAVFGGGAVPASVAGMVAAMASPSENSYQVAVENCSSRRILDELARRLEIS